VWPESAIRSALQRAEDVVAGRPATPEGAVAGIATMDLACLVDVVRTFLAAEEVTEHGQQMSGGGFHVRVSGPEYERYYPLDQWIEHKTRDGNCWRRRVVVVEDWTEVTEQ
jgi:hypothetical protein